MHAMRVGIVVGTMLLTACGSDDRAASGDAAVDAAVGMDADVGTDAEGGDAATMSFDFSCASNTTPPTTADDPISVAGLVRGLEQDIYGDVYLVPVSGAALKLCDAAVANCNGPNVDASATTDASGNFSLMSVATGGTGLPDYLQMTKNGYRPSYVYPASTFNKSITGLEIRSYLTSQQQALTGCDTSMAMLFITVTDCAGAPIEVPPGMFDASVTVRQGGAAVGGINYSYTSSGTFVVCQVPADAATEVTATYDSHTFLARTVRTVAGATTDLVLVPGF